MSDDSDPRHANPDPAKRHQAPEVPSARPAALAPAPRLAPVAPTTLETEMAAILNAVADAIHGPPPPGRLHGWADLPDRVRALCPPPRPPRRWAAPELTRPLVDQYRQATDAIAALHEERAVTRRILSAGQGESVDDAARRQMAELEANRKLRQDAEGRVLQLEQEAAMRRRDHDTLRRDGEAWLKERNDLEQRRRDWHEERKQMVKLLESVIPALSRVANCDSLVDIAHGVVNEMLAGRVAPWLKGFWSWSRFT